VEALALAKQTDIGKWIDHRGPETLPRVLEKWGSFPEEGKQSRI